jgi:hypothetical protein
MFWVYFKRLLVIPDPGVDYVPANEGGTTESRRVRGWYVHTRNLLGNLEFVEPLSLFLSLSLSFLFSLEEVLLVNTDGGVVVLGGLVAGKAVASCERMDLPADVGGNDALAMLLGQATWEDLNAPLPEPRSHCVALSAWLVVDDAQYPEPEPEPEPDSEPGLTAASSRQERLEKLLPIGLEHRQPEPEQEQEQGGEDCP